MTLLKCRWLTFSRGWWGVFTFSTYINSVFCLKGRGVKVFRAPLSRLILSVPLCFNLMSFFCFVFCLQDFKNALESEVRLSVREHLEARCIVSAQGAVHWTTSGTAACLIREVWHYVARVGQCLWRLSFHQKVEIPPTPMLIVQLSEVLSRKLLFCYSTPPDNLSIQEFQKNEAIDVEVRACF